jgi:hypothetical protein
MLLEDLMKQKSPRRSDWSGVRALAHMTRLPPLNPRKAPVQPTPAKVVPGYEDEEDDVLDQRPTGKVTTSASAPELVATDVLEGFQLELQRLKQECDKAYRAYETMPDAAVKRELWQTWKSMLDAWGKLAKIAPTAEKEAGQLMRVTDVDAVWSRTFSEMKVELEALPRRISTRSELRAIDPVTIELLVEAEVIKVMTIFKKGGNLNANS